MEESIEEEMVKPQGKDEPIIIRDNPCTRGDVDGDADELLGESSGVKAIGLNHLQNSESDEVKITILEKTISELQSDFGEKRAKFKKLFMQKEEELENERKARNVVEMELKSVQDELNESKSQVTIEQLSKENEVYLERERCAQIKKYHEETSSELRAKYDTELQRLRSYNIRLETELNEIKTYINSGGNTAGNSEVSPGAVFSGAVNLTKSLARKLNSTLSTSNDSLPDIEENSNKIKISKYAQEDAEMLRSLVVQLEEELTVLKNKVRSSEDQLSAFQNAQASLVKSLLQPGEPGSDPEAEVALQLDEKLREARTGLEAEKSSRADLEMYIALVNTQKTIYHDDLEKTKSQLKELRIRYEDERKSHEDLKETWKKANEQFVQTQEAYESTIRRLKSMMSPKQLELIKTEFNNITEPIEVEQKSIVEEKTDELFKCEDCERYQITIEKLRSDLHKAAKNRNEMEDGWSRSSQDYQNKIISIEEQLKTYEVVLMELHNSFQQSIHETERQIKRMTLERDSIQKKIESIELENDNLRGKNVAHSEQLQNEDISLPNDVMPLQEMVLRLKEDLINVKVGKEEVESELKFLKDRVQMEEEERRGIEENLNGEINNLRERLTDYKIKKHKYIDDLKRYEKLVGDLRIKLQTYESGDHQQQKQDNNKSNSSTSSGKEKQVEELTKEKQTLYRENQELQSKISSLRKDLTNSEDLQRDLISLSKSLQVGLESIRQAEKEVRWQFPDDISQCTGCKKIFDVQLKKENCCHCGRVYCPDCLARSIRQGTRDYSVCGFCHTLLSQDSAPYFSTEPPHSPD